MLYREIIYIQIHIKTRKYTVWAERRFVLALNLVVCKVTTGLYSFREEGVDMMPSSGVYLMTKEE